MIIESTRNGWIIIKCHIVAHYSQLSNTYATDLPFYFDPTRKNLSFFFSLEQVLQHVKARFAYCTEHGLLKHDLLKKPQLAEFGFIPLCTNHKVYVHAVH